MAAKRGRKPIDRGPVVQPLAEVPEPPEHLGKLAADYWRTLAPQLVQIQALTPIHLESFATLCEQWELYRRTSDWLAEDPDRWYQTAPSGYQQVAPQVGVRERALANLQKIWPKFGLTPESMAKLGKHGGVRPPREVGGFGDFAAGRNDGDPEPPE